MHDFLRKVFPFLYVRNWYTGQLEFSQSRALMYTVGTAVVLFLVLLVWWLGQPIEYSRPI